VLVFSQVNCAVREGYGLARPVGVLVQLGLRHAITPRARSGWGGACDLAVCVADDYLVVLAEVLGDFDGLDIVAVVQTWCGHGVLAHNLVKIANLANANSA
jgi:hypothetical protein